MSTLVLVINFLMIFLFLSGTILKNAIFFSSEKTSISNYLSTKIALQSKWERYKLASYAKSAAAPAEKKEKKEPTVKKTAVFSSHRTKDSVPSGGKWNLMPLFSSDPYVSFFMQQMTERLLEELYGHANFWKEARKENEKFVQSLIKEFFRNKEQARLVSDLFPSDPKLQKIFYKMLQGSGSYHVASKQGYPPLDHFFCIDRKNKALVQFPYAPLPVIKALFRETIVESILSLEKEKWEKDQCIHSLTKEELSQLCQGNALAVQGKKFQDLSPFLLFSHKRARLEKLSSKDPQHRVTLELPLPRQSH